MAKIKLDHGGIAEVLRSAAVAGVIRSAASGIAASVDPSLTNGEVMPVYVNSGTTDRASSSVVIGHPAAIRVEAKYGRLLKAAGESGLDVNARA